MNYSLALKLKENGFPQDDKQGYISCGCNEVRCSGQDKPVEVYDCGRERVYFPTLEELIEACGEKFQSINKTHNGKWGCSGFTDIPFYTEADSALEAVVNLWLALHPKK